MLLCRFPGKFELTALVAVITDYLIEFLSMILKTAALISVGFSLTRVYN